MRKQVWAWQCELELCGHVWLAAGIEAPAKCAKCKRRGWHTKNSGVAQSAEPDTKRRKDETCDAHDGSEVDSVDQMQSLGRARTDHSISIADDVQAMSSPCQVDMQALRDICAGKFSDSPYVSPESPEQDRINRDGMKRMIAMVTEIPICGFKWWEDGEQYECLMDKGHKSPKHGQRGMVQRVES